MASPSSAPKNCADDDHLSRSLQFYQAVLQGNLDSVKTHNSQDSDLAASLNANTDTALHVAAGTGTADNVVEYLLSELSEEQASLQNTDGNTAVATAAIVGNVKAAQMMLKKNPNLNGVANQSGWIPLIEAARHTHLDMVKFLLDFIEHDHYLDPLKYATGRMGAFFVNSLIIAGFYDLALKHLRRYPQVALIEVSDGESVFSTLVGRPSAFPSGKQLSFWESLLYHCNPMELDSGGCDIIKAKFMHGHESCLNRAFRTMQAALRKLLPYLVPKTKEIQEIKLKHHQALQLVKQLCKEAATSLDHARASSMFGPPLFLAVELGVLEVVEEIIVSFPHAVWFSDDENHNSFHWAVINRQEKIWNLMHQINNCKHLLLLSKDTSGNNILHLAGKLTPQHRLNIISGAALQMQRELQWFKEVGTAVLPSYKEDRNSQGKTPAMVFTEQHEKLVKEGERWMKDTASSCTVVAALIATVVFAAAITVPGGSNNENGQPIFFKHTAFIIFGISDALSLFSSVAAILTLLSILTARYAEDDFLTALPKKLIWALVTLFLSITSMMVAFSAAIYMVFYDKTAWMLIPVGGIACLTITLFASLQFPLVVDMLYSTYGPGIFGMQSKRMLY